MAKKKSAKRLDDHIAELEAVVSEIHTCAACGKPIEPDAATCPHCGTPVGEAAELHEKAAESLSDLEKQLAETSPPPPEPAPPPPEDLRRDGLESAAEVVAIMSVPAPAPETAAMAQEAPPELVPPVEPENETEEEAGGSGDLEVFIEEIEAEVSPAAPRAASVAPRPTSAAKPTVRAVPRTAHARTARRWVAPVAAGAVLYVLALFLVALLGRYLVASFMVIGTFLVVAGIRWKPVVGPGQEAGSGSSVVEDYVCPLCGTGIPARATVCPTCGAVFEE